jgi:pimeloyl-ACP methyl ester carboxylesterase
MWETSRFFQRWKPVIEEKMPVKTIDLNPTCDSTFRFSDYKDQVRTDLKKIDAGKIFLIGHSMGGLLAQAADDERIVARGLVAPGAPKGIFGIRNWDLFFSLLRELYQLCHSLVKPTKFSANRVVYNQHKKLGIPWNIEKCPPIPLVTFLQVGLGISTEVPKRGNTHVVVGECDKLTPPSVAKWIALKHNATLKVFPNHDHISILNDTEVARYLVEKGIENT